MLDTSHYELNQVLMDSFVEGPRAHRKQGYKHVGGLTKCHAAGSFSPPAPTSSRTGASRWYNYLEENGIARRVISGLIARAVVVVVVVVVAVVVGSCSQSRRRLNSKCVYARQQSAVARNNST